MNESADSWEHRMAAQAAQRAARHRAAERAENGAPIRLLPDRSAWPVPREIQGASARDAFLWYVCRGWEQIFGDEPEIENLFDHDFGLHVLRKGEWQLTFANISEFPSQEWTP